MTKIVFILSTNGGVLSSLLRHEFVRNITESIVVDRECGAVDLANTNKIKLLKLFSSSGATFSEALNNEFTRRDIIFISFYTRVLSDAFLEPRRGMVFNCHPSILPSCRGLNGFMDTINSNSLFIGCTLHEVEKEIDSGKSVIQAAIPLDRSQSIEVNRHKVFLAQYYSTLQFILWIKNGRFITSGGDWTVLNASYSNSLFSPNLDANFFQLLNIVNEL